MHLRERRRGRQTSMEAPSGPTADDSALARFTAVEEASLAEADRLPRPAGFGDEVSTSQQSKQVIDRYVVPPGSIAKLREVSLSVESNGEAVVSAGGTQFGPYSGSIDITIPLDPCVLPPGYEIVVLHESTDGNSTTTRAQVVAAEV